MYIYCLYLAMLKAQNNCFTRAETSIVLIVFDGVLCEVLNYTVTVAQHESGIRKAISWSVTVYNKTLSSKCNLIAEIKPVQDKECYLNLSLFITNFLFQLVD